MASREGNTLRRTLSAFFELTRVPSIVNAGIPKYNDGKLRGCDGAGAGERPLRGEYR